MQLLAAPEFLDGRTLPLERSACGHRGLSPHRGAEAEPAAELGSQECGDEEGLVANLRKEDEGEGSREP